MARESRARLLDAFGRLGVAAAAGRWVSEDAGAVWAASLAGRAGVAIVRVSEGDRLDCTGGGWEHGQTWAAPRAIKVAFAVVLADGLPADDRRYLRASRAAEVASARLLAYERGCFPARPRGLFGA